MANATSAVLASYGSVPFTPSSLPLVLWLDATDAATRYDATVAGSLVTANAANVKRINDKSTGLYHASNATGVTLRTGALAGKDALHFTGVSTHLENLLMPLDLRNFTVCMCFFQITELNNAGLISFGANSGASDAGLGHASIAGGFPGSVGRYIAADNIAGFALASTHPHPKMVEIIEFSATDNVQDVIVDGVPGTAALATSKTYAGVSSTSNLGFVLGNRFFNTISSTLGVPGYFGELFVVNRRLTSTEKTDVTNYLMAKFLRSGIDRDVDGWADRVSVADAALLATTTIVAASVMVTGLKADGIWTKIKGFFVYAGPASLSGALVPLKSNITPANVNFVSGDHDRLTGLKGNGSSKYINTGIANNVLSNTSMSLFTYGSGFETGPTDGVAIGAFNGAGANLSSLDLWANYITARAFRHGTGTAADLPNITSGLITSGSVAGSRISATSATLYQNGLPVALKTNSVATANSTRPFFLFCLNNSGTPLSYSAARFAVQVIADGLTDAENLSLHNRVATYIASLV